METRQAGGLHDELVVADAFLVPEVLAIYRIPASFFKWFHALAWLATCEPDGTHRGQDWHRDRSRQGVGLCSVADPGQQWRVRARYKRGAAWLDVCNGWQVGAAFVVSQPGSGDQWACGDLP